MSRILYFRKLSGDLRKEKINPDKITQGAILERVLDEVKT